MNPRHTDLYVTSALSVAGFIGLATLIGWYQANPTAEQKAKQAIITTAQNEKVAIKSKGEVAQTATREGQVYTDSIQLAGVNKGQFQPPTIPATHFNTRFRRVVLDQQGQCIGFTQEGNFFSVHPYPNIPNYLYLPNGCEEYSQSKTNDTTNQWHALPPPLDQVQDPTTLNNQP